MAREGSNAALGAPRPGTLVAILIVCAVSGFALARASLDVDRAALARRADQARAASDPQETEAAPADASTGTTGNATTPTVTADDPVAEDAGTIGAVAEPTDASTASAPAPSPGSGTAEIVEGRVAYIRCEGLANIPPSGPCPRDHGVEARVWEAIRALSACPALANASGSSDVRVVFDGMRVSGLGFRDMPDELDRESVRGCLEPALERVRTSLGTSRLTASFRFELIR